MYKWTWEVQTHVVQGLTIDILTHDHRMYKMLFWIRGYRLTFPQETFFLIANSLLGFRNSKCIRIGYGAFKN